MAYRGKDNEVHVVFIFGVLLMHVISTLADCSLSDEVTSLEGVVRVEDKTTYSLWESVDFTCKEGYEPLLTDFVAFCTDNGNFEPDPIIFSCSKTCHPPSVEADTTYTSGEAEEPDAYDAYAVVEFNCSPDVDVGYLEEGVQPFAYCNSGTWEPSTFPDCKVSCAIPTVQNDTVYETSEPQEDVGYIRHDTSIVYACSDDIPAGTLQGPESAVCIDGKFDETSETDCKVSCESPPGVEPSGLTDHGMSVNFTCLGQGGRIEDGSDVICEDGEWSTYPECSFLCPGRDEYYIPTNPSSTRKRRSLGTIPQLSTDVIDREYRVVGLTAGLVAAVTTTTAVAFVAVVVKAGDEFSEIF